MPQRRSWSDEQLEDAVAHSRSYRQVISKLGLMPAGGNYSHVKQRIGDLGLDITHFTGKGWNTGLKFNPKPAVSLESLLVKNSTAQSYKLKNVFLPLELKYRSVNFVAGQKKCMMVEFPLNLTILTAIVMTTE